MYKPKARFWYLTDDQRVVPCSEEEWSEFRRDASRFMIGSTYVEPGFMVRTQFIGRQVRNHPPQLFLTEVHSDLGVASMMTRTHDEAVTLHNLECLRLVSIVKRNRWDKIAHLKDFNDA